MKRHHNSKRKRRRQRKQLNTQTKVDCPEIDAGSTVEGSVCTTTIINAPPDLTPHLPPDTPSVSHKKIHLYSDSDEDVNDEDNPAILNRIVQCGQNIYDEAEFVLEEGIGPVLKFADKGGGVALTPIKMPNLDDEENEIDDDDANKYLKACKSIEYVQVDGRPGLTLHRGCHRFWTAIAVTPDVVRTKT